MLSCLFALLWHLLPAALPADTISLEPYIVVDNIRIEGARRTQSSLILRELDFREGDTLPGKQVREILQRNRNKIFNTNLFVTVDLSLEPGQSGQIELLIKVTEQWYIFPMVIFELADRNFNEWWVERGRDLRRTNYGARVAHKNFRGRGEELRAAAQFGFTKRFELGYNIRYLDRKQKNGLGFLVSYSQNKTVAFRTRAGNPNRTLSPDSWNRVAGPGRTPAPELRRTSTISSLADHTGYSLFLGTLL